MKKLKKLLPVLIMSIMSVSAFAEDAVIDGINYSLNDKTSEAKVVPNYYNENIFDSQKKYSGDITIPETVDYAGKTYSVTSIGEYAFYNCKDLTSVNIPNSVTAIESSAFESCSSLASITIPNSVTTIGDEVFSGCTGLTSVTIPNSVTTIGDEVFISCTGLTSVTIGKGVTTIGDGAFFNCPSLESIIIEYDNFVYDSRDNSNAIIETETSTLITGCKNTVIPVSVTAIGDGAFCGCSGLTSITIPNSITTIGEGAFFGCTGLTSITIPKSVTKIGDGIFTATGLETIIVENSNPVYDSRNNGNAIIETKTNTLIAGCKNTVIPGSVTTINDFAFFLCPGLTSIVIPNSVTSIGECAFYGCTGLTSIISLIEEPFEIEDDVFEMADDVPWDYEITSEFTTATLYVPTGTKAKYESTPAWNMFTNIVEGIENDVKSVETDAKAEETERYNIGGQRINSPQKGLNIVKMSNGTTRKVVVK